MPQREMDPAVLLELVFDHYDLAYPNGYGERQIHCPVHDDSHKSASLNTAKGLWTCMACGAGGSAFDLVMQREGLTYVEARRICQEVYDRGDGKVRERSAGERGSLLPRKSRDRRERRGYVPPWSRL